MAKPPVALSLPRTDLAKQTLHPRLSIMNTAAVDLADDQGVYRAAYVEAIARDGQAVSILARRLGIDCRVQAPRHGRNGARLSRAGTPRFCRFRKSKSLARKGLKQGFRAAGRPWDGQDSP